MNGPSGPSKIEMTPQDYIKRGRALFAAIERFKELRVRIGRSMPSMTQKDREEYGERAKMIDEKIIKVYADSHFRPIERCLATRSLDLAYVYAELIDLIDKLSEPF